MDRPVCKACAAWNAANIFFHRALFASHVQEQEWNPI